MTRDSVRHPTGLKPERVQGEACQSGARERNRPIATFIDHLSSLETPTVLAVRRMAQQIREQEQ